ncbi:MAG: NAD(P)-dependent oxidoreductase [Microbacteriaceae bacterium]|nr:NAD(P)-dependent oxidoreductase [Microbacteriaceae bacterium]
MIDSADRTEKPLRIVVTGASGFVGGQVATALANDGHDVIGVARRKNGWTHQNGRYLSADLSVRPDAVFVADADVVVNAAASTDTLLPIAEALRQNRDSTLHLPLAFPGARIVHISSSSVYPVSWGGALLREEDATATRFLSSYSASKWAAEQTLAKMPQGKSAIVLRPHAVYGAGDKTLLPRLEQLLRGNFLVLPKGTDCPHTLTSITNLVNAVRCAVRSGASAGTYNITDAGEVSLTDVFRKVLGLRTGRKIRVLQIPTGLAWRVATLAERLYRVGLVGASSVNRYAIHAIAAPKRLDIFRARTELGYEPLPTDLSDAAIW